ncbi:MAG: hypothetical protein IKM31_00595 [Oscillospiraceae bacterium]|nr:hypothetical protein [Oscillospiraceae bacterium]
MIHTIRTMALSVCGTMIVTGIFMMLVPSAGQNKALRLAASLFFLLSLAAPLTGRHAEWETDFSLWNEKGESVTDFRTLTEQALLNDFRRRLEHEALAILDEEGIVPRSLEFSIHIDEENRISITGLELLLDEEDADRSADAIARLNETFGLTLTLALSGNGGGEG